MRGLTFSPDGRELVAGFYTPELRAMPSVVWDVASGVARLQHQGHDDTASAVAVSPDGRLVATGGGLDHAIRVWDRRTGKLEQELVGSGRGVRSVAWHRDGRRLAWGARAAAPEHVIALPLGGRRELGPFDRIDRGRRADWQGETASNGQTQLTVGRGGTHGFQDAVLEVRGAAGDVRIERCSLTGDRHTSRTLTPDGRAVVSGGANGWLERYDIDRLANLRRTPCDRTTSRDLEDRLRFIGHEGDVVALSVSPDGRLLATGSIDQTLRLWSLATRELIASFLFTEDGRWVGWTVSASPFLQSSVVPKHKLVATGTYDLPWGILTSAKLILATPKVIRDFNCSAAGCVADTVEKKSFRQVDLSVGKSFAVGNGYTVGVRLDLINAFDYRNYSDYIVDWSTHTATPNQAGNLDGPPRTLKLGLNASW